MSFLKLWIAVFLRYEYNFSCYRVSHVIMSHDVLFVHFVGDCNSVVWPCRQAVLQIELPNDIYHSLAISTDLLTFLYSDLSVAMTESYSRTELFFTSSSVCWHSDRLGWRRSLISECRCEDMPSTYLLWPAWLHSRSSRVRNRPSSLFRNVAMLMKFLQSYK